MPLGLLPSGSAVAARASSEGTFAVGVREGLDVCVGARGERADGGLGRGAAGLGERGAEARLLEEVGRLSEAASCEVGSGRAQRGARGRVEELTVRFFVLVLEKRVENGEERSGKKRLRSKTKKNKFDSPLASRAGSVAGRRVFLFASKASYYCLAPD